MNEKELPITELTDEDKNPMAVFAAIEANIHAMGANDSEGDELRLIKAAVNAKKITPQEAVKLAREIEQNKLDYH